MLKVIAYKLSTFLKHYTTIHIQYSKVLKRILKVYL